jgi:hypothetical protein
LIGRMGSDDQVERQQSRDETSDCFGRSDHR